jgi:hypothetical protein
MKDAKSRDLSELFNTITVRNVPADVDEAITSQAKAAGKSKSDFVQEFLTATFGDLIGNFIRTSDLVALMDQEMARMAGTVLSEHVYDLDMTQAGHREFCRILGIKNNDDLQRIMLAGMPYLEIRAGQLRGIDSLARGNSLYAALLVNAASRDEETLLALHRSLFNMILKVPFRKWLMSCERRCEWKRLNGRLSEQVYKRGKPTIGGLPVTLCL